MVDETISRLCRIEQAATVEELRTVCFDLCAKYGYDWFGYILNVADSVPEPTVHAIDGCPPEWIERWLGDEQCMVESGAFYDHFSYRATPIWWGRAYHAPLLTRDPIGVEHIESAKRRGLSSAILIPVRGPRGDIGTFSVFSQRDDIPQENALDALADWSRYAPFLHEAALRMLLRTDTRRYSLTVREKECLRWSSDGKTAREISHILGISERGIVFHLRNACRKMGVSNKQHAIARALATGMIHTSYLAGLKRKNVHGQVLSFRLISGAETGESRLAMRTHHQP